MKVTMHTHVSCDLDVRTICKHMYLLETAINQPSFSWNYRTISNRMKLLIKCNQRNSILRAFLNNYAHHTRNTYIISPNVFSMVALALINEIN